MVDFMILLYEHGVPKEKHLISLPAVGEDDFYRQATSLDAFKDREATRLYKKHLKGKADVKGKRCWVRRADEFYAEVSSTVQAMKKYIPDYEHDFQNVSAFRHNNIWEFYACIGYDYKKKKYIS